MGKKTHGMRGPAAQAKKDARTQAYRDRNPEKIKAAVERDLYTHRIKKFPLDFLSIKRDGALVRDIIHNNFPFSPDELTALPEHGKVVLPLDHLPSGTVPDGMPPYLAIRYEHFLSKDHQRRLILRWDEVVASHPVNHLKPDTNRSTSDAHHLGIWEVFGATPRMTADTRKQTAEAKEAIDQLLWYVQSFMAPKLATAYAQHAPLHWKALQKVHARVHQHLGHDLLSRPRVDMGGPFFAVAVKEAGSGVVHLDWNDNKAIYAYVFAVGDWEGGEFCIPQLKIKIPVRPGQIHSPAIATTTLDITKRTNRDTISDLHPVIDSSVNLDMFPPGIYRDPLWRSIQANEGHSNSRVPEPEPTPPTHEPSTMFSFGNSDEDNDSALDPPKCPYHNLQAFSFLTTSQRLHLYKFAPIRVQVSRGISTPNSVLSVTRLPPTSRNRDSTGQ
ncbi:hypothetical protein EV702DRAFT_1250013 [Suillus placidus]|uniref:Uncharacterized protein n=1 Tax=Suillus placidus TaxID=48579 RepID=A0A9P6ZKR5_9AGAM|nr:hypothetical protein EV702DRAFT_1250013 [Suillus placidus]